MLNSFYSSLRTYRRAGKREEERKREEGGGKREVGRGKREEGPGMRNEGRGRGQRAIWPILCYLGKEFGVNLSHAGFKLNQVGHKLVQVSFMSDLK